MSTTLREFAVEYGMHFVGRPYRWGGDDPMAGFDCSGLCIEVLKAVGLFPRNDDMTADGLWKKYKRVLSTQVQPGCLVLFGANNTATHVEMVVRIDTDAGGSDIFTLGASGGGSKTITEADAMAQNAYIKVRPILMMGARTDVLGFVDPFVS